jgi:hypothetical protein
LRLRISLHVGLPIFYFHFTRLFVVAGASTPNAHCRTNVTRRRYDLIFDPQFPATAGTAKGRLLLLWNNKKLTPFQYVVPDPHAQSSIDIRRAAKARGWTRDTTSRPTVWQ